MNEYYAKKAREREVRKNEVTRKVAIVLVFAAVFYFFIKLLFL